MILTVSARRRRRDQEVYPLPASGALCITPTYDGSGNIVHPSVVDMGTRWNGYRWWRADTPYSGANAAAIENPSIWGSNDRLNWEVPAGLTNPIDPWPGEATTNYQWYNSDTELVWDPQYRRLVCVWREYEPGYGLTFWAASSEDGITWTHHPDPLLTPAQNQGVVLKSPTIVRAPDGVWRMMTMDGVADVTVMPGTQMWTAPALLGPWTKDTTTPTVFALPDGSGPYHGDMIYHGGVWLAIVRGVYAAASLDGYVWTVGATPIPGISSYRPTMLPSTEAGFYDVWTSTNRYHRVPASYWTALLP